MNNSQPQIDAIRALGYSEQESRFLYLVAMHSGYFVARQFLGFTGAYPGGRITRFRTKLQASQHMGGAVYHLFCRKIYRQIGHENLRNRRGHEFEHIRTRIAMLDFVLGNLNNQYLETESDKVAYFCSQLNVPAHQLPSQSYAGRYTAKATIRYFLDRYPMFFPPAPAPRIVTFTYLQDPEASLAGFAHHLHAYLPLFRQLSEFNFLFLARTDSHFVRASELFRDLVAIPLESNSAEDLLRYFRIRKAWDLAQYTSVTEGDLIFRNLAKQRFCGARFEHFYRAWKVGRVSETEIREDLSGSDKPHVVHFDRQILKAIAGPESNHGGKQFLKLTSKEEIMPIVKKAPAILTREVRMEEPVSVLLDDYAQFIESSSDHVVNSVLKKTLWRDQEYRKWREQRRSRPAEAPATADRATKS